MSPMTDDTHADDSRGSLGGQLPAVEPPVGLEARVKATLEARGLVTPAGSAHERTPASRRLAASAWMPRLGFLAAGLLLGFLARTALGTTGGRPPAAATGGQYVLLLYGDPPDDTGAVHVAREREYGRWASQLTRGARWVAGHELGDVIASLGQSDAVASAPERLAGYFVIDAASRERAAEVARSCPHLKYGGRVVVMAVE